MGNPLAGRDPVLTSTPVYLVAGETYYLNIRNYSPDLGGLSCFGVTCNAAIITNWPKNN